MDRRDRMMPRMVSPTRRLEGGSPDAISFSCLIRDGRAHRQSGLIYRRFVFPDEPVQPTAARAVAPAGLAEN